MAVEPIRRAAMIGDGECGIEWGDNDCVATVENGTGIFKEMAAIPLRNEGFCACGMSRSHKIFQVFAFVFSYAFPLVIILLSYSSIVREVRHVEINAQCRKLENQR